jgi:hypothetical protein
MERCFMPDSRAITPADFTGAENYVLENTAEQIYLEEAAASDAASQPKTVAERITLRDRLRRICIEITLYEEGFLRLADARGGSRRKSHVLNLRYLDPVPSVRRHYPKRLLRAAAGCGVATVIAALLAQVPALAPFAYAIAALAAAAMLGALAWFVYSSHERVVYRTLHGRAAALTLTAGLGCIRRFRAAMPTIIRAIERAEETIGDDTAIYLRAEMREHYRLRGDGVLSEHDCSEGTGRILLHFDDEL